MKVKPLKAGTLHCPKDYHLLWWKTYADSRMRIKLESENGQVYNAFCPECKIYYQVSVHKNPIKRNPLTPTNHERHESK